jgi:hypothetical protein
MPVWKFSTNVPPLSFHAQMVAHVTRQVQSPSVFSGNVVPFLAIHISNTFVELAPLASFELLWEFLRPHLTSSSFRGDIFRRELGSQIQLVVIIWDRHQE